MQMRHFCNFFLWNFSLNRLRDFYFYCCLFNLTTLHWNAEQSSLVIIIDASWPWAMFFFSFSFFISRSLHGCSVQWFSNTNHVWTSVFFFCVSWKWPRYEEIKSWSEMFFFQTWRFHRRLRFHRHCDCSPALQSRWRCQSRSQFRLTLLPYNSHVWSLCSARAVMR